MADNTLVVSSPWCAKFKEHKRAQNHLGRWSNQQGTCRNMERLPSVRLGTI
jgi:hypothetical protein